jgi:peptidyl-prolyl cis-trans isomerase A (cyclophilin A)
MKAPHPNPLLAVVLVAGLAPACSREAPPPPSRESGTAAAATPPAAVAAAVPAAVPSGKDPSAATARAPAVFKVRFNTTKGDFVVEAHRDWAPNGVDRFYNLVKLGMLDDVGFFRAIDGFMVQFGIPGDPALSARWRGANIPDDPVGKQSNLRGFVTFAMAGPNTRTTQLFINYADNSRLDSMGFPPIGKVVEGMKVVDSLFKTGENPPQVQGALQMRGNAYLHQAFPQLDYVKTATLVP